MSEPTTAATDENDDEPVELDNFDIRQVHLVGDPANGRRILTQKGVRMATQTDPAAASAADAGSDNADPAAAATADEASATPASLKLASPIRGSLLATLQDCGDKIAALMQAVDAAEPTDDMSVPSDVQTAMDAIQQCMQMGLQPFSVSKARSLRLSGDVQGLLDIFRAALNGMPTGAPEAAATAVAPAAVDPAAAAAAAAAVPEAVVKSLEASKVELQGVRDELAKRDAVIKSLQDDVLALRRQPASSAVLTGGGPAPAPARKRLSSQDFPDLNKYIKYTAEMDAADNAAAHTRR